MKKNILFVLLALVAWSFKASEKIQVIKPSTFYNIKVQEPSDICLAADGKSFFMVSDNGLLYQTDLTGNILKKADFTGIDFEAVYADAQFVYVMDETPRTVRIYDQATLEIKRNIPLHYAGGRNKGFESLTFNPEKKVFITLTEKDPIWVREYSQDFVLQNEFVFKGASDISAATFYNQSLFLLSDEDRMVLRLDPNTYEILEKKIVPIINPEGIAFDLEGKMFITSDDMERLYVFNKIW